MTEVPATGSSPELALLVSGDGGWAGLDQELAARLAAAGVPTVALNSLQYFWSPRTPEQTAADVARVLRHYLAAWNKQRVLLIGYSFGADVLPFVVNRLPPELRARIVSVSLLGIEAHASFEVSIADWVGSDAGGPATQPELEIVKTQNGIRILIHGEVGRTYVLEDAAGLPATEWLHPQNVVASEVITSVDLPAPTSAVYWRARVL